MIPWSTVLYSRKHADSYLKLFIHVLVMRFSLLFWDMWKLEVVIGYSEKELSLYIWGTFSNMLWKATI